MPRLHPHASALFCATINFIVEHVSHKGGISISIAWFSDLVYAVDVVLFAERQEILVSALQSMEEESSKGKDKVPELRSWTWRTGPAC